VAFWSRHDKLEDRLRAERPRPSDDLISSIKGDLADVKSKIEDKPLELKMKRVGDRWVVVGVHDQELSNKIARTVGQQIIAIASGANIGDASKNLGVQNLQQVLKQAEGLLR